MTIRFQKLLRCRQEGCPQEAAVDYYPVRWSDLVPHFVLWHKAEGEHQLEVWQGGTRCLELGATTLEIDGVKRRMTAPKYLSDGTYRTATLADAEEEE